jgi:hypothetical protein
MMAVFLVTVALFVVLAAINSCREGNRQRPVR